MAKAGREKKDARAEDSTIREVAAPVTSKNLDLVQTQNHRELPTIPVATAIDGRRKRMQAPAPYELNVYLTDNCNLKCSFCPLTHGKIPTSKQDVTPELIDQVIDMYPTIRSACVAGFGEPLVSKQVFPAIQRLKERRIYVGLITNGILVPKKINELVAARPDHVSVSLNVTNEEELMALEDAKPGDWDRMLEGVRLLVKNRIKTFVSFIATKSNYMTIPDMINLGVSLGAPVITIVNILPNVGDIYHKCEGFWKDVITDEDVAVNTAIHSFKYLQGAERVSVWPQSISKKWCPSTCASPFVSLGINGDGFVNGCRRVAPPKKGNGHLSEGYQNPYFTRFREGLLGEGPLPDVCSMCFGNWQQL